MDGAQEIVKITTDRIANSPANDLFAPIPHSEKSYSQVHLGQLPLTPHGFSYGFKDRDAMRIPKMGIIFTVEQTSYGSTGIEASADDGFEIESFRVNPETKQPEWMQPNPVSKVVSVSLDWGNLQKIAPDSLNWKQENMGNPGIRAGVIRVTNKSSGEVKYYGLGAQFSGKPDNWWVKRGVIELQPVSKLPQSPKPLPQPSEN